MAEIISIMDIHALDIDAQMGSGVHGFSGSVNPRSGNFTEKTEKIAPHFLATPVVYFG
jgi:hypothetical protein